MLRGGPSSREGGLCLQAVFSLLDVLHKWGEDAKSALSQGGQNASLAGQGRRADRPSGRRAGGDAALALRLSLQPLCFAIRGVPGHGRIPLPLCALPT